MADRDLDVVVVGAGFAGLYMLYRLRGLGFSAKVIESADDVGGTWYWNRYPGARCDIESIDYSYSFDPELETEWQWSERYATQPEILRYLGHVADKHDLRRDIRFSTRVEGCRMGRRRVALARAHRPRRRDPLPVLRDGDGCLSLPKAPDIEGVDRFRGRVVLHRPLAARRASTSPASGSAVIGTGSSAIQSIPIIAQQAAELTVFQRTPNFSRPAYNGPVSAEKKASFDADPAAYREAARWSRAGVPREPSMVRALQVSEAERLATYEEAYASGDLLAFGAAYADIGVNPEANETVCEFLRGEDPLDRARSRDRGDALPEEPLLRHQAPVHRYRLLTRPSTCRTSASSICARTRSGRSPRRASTRRRGRSSSTPSCSRRASTR